MKPLRLIDIAKAVNGLCSADTEITSVFTDSRKPVKGGMFIAIKGERFDAHDFIESLEGSEAAAVFCHKDIKTSLPKVLVDDTRQGLIDFASYYRGMFDIPFVALTGSVGKTTTKEMVHCVLSAKYNTYKTAGNLNNDIGVPITLLRLEEEHEAAVIEMGMNHIGEIGLLSRAARPDFALITNIGVSHIEHLGSRENILKAKLEILEGMRQGSVIMLNGDDDMLQNARTPGYEAVYYGLKNKKALVTASDIQEKNGYTDFVAHIAGKAQRVTLPIMGIHNVYNALAALLSGHLLDVPPEAAAQALLNYTPEGMRQRLNNIAGIQVIEDCYNASPDSVKAAINVLASLKAENKIAVLGDMLEMGSYSPTAHSLVGEYVANGKIDVLLTYGEEAKMIAKTAVEGGVKTVYSFTDAETLAQMLAEIASPGDAVLFKASNGMKLENIIEKFYNLLDSD